MMISGELRTAMRNDVQSAILCLSTPDNYSQRMAQVAVICVSIGGFEARFKENLPLSKHVDRVVNPYFEKVTQKIVSAGGIINYFDDDRVFAFFDMTQRQPSLDFLVELGRLMVQILRDRLPQESVGNVGVGVTYGEMLLNEMQTGETSYKNVYGDLGRLAQRLSSVDDDKVRISLSVYQNLDDKVGLERDHSLQPHHVFSLAV